MSGPIFAIPSLEGLREAREIATPASTPRRAGSERRDALGTILYLGCIALVGALTACTLVRRRLLSCHASNGQGYLTDRWDAGIEAVSSVGARHSGWRLRPTAAGLSRCDRAVGGTGATGLDCLSFYRRARTAPRARRPKSRAETVGDRLGANHIRPGYRGHRCDDLGCRRPNCSSLGDPAMASNPAAILDRSESPGKCRGPD